MLVVLASEGQIMLSSAQALRTEEKEHKRSLTHHCARNTWPSTQHALGHPVRVRWNKLNLISQMIMENEGSDKFCL